MSSTPSPSAGVRHVTPFKRAHFRPPQPAHEQQAGDHGVESAPAVRRGVGFDAPAVRAGTGGGGENRGEPVRAARLEELAEVDGQRGGAGTQPGRAPASLAGPGRYRGARLSAGTGAVCVRAEHEKGKGVGRPGRVRGRRVDRLRGSPGRAALASATARHGPGVSASTGELLCVNR